MLSLCALEVVAGDVNHSHWVIYVDLISKGGKQFIVANSMNASLQS